jgi:ABC-type nitrate/sulfonate/bicarbonate transport system permease component
VSSSTLQGHSGGLTLQGRLLSHATRAGFLVALLACWYAVTVTGLVSNLFLPKPQEVLSIFVSLVQSGEVAEDLIVTLAEFAVACPLAILLGTLCGYLVSLRPYSVQVFEPVFAGLYAIPIIIFYPVAVLLFGIGPASKIAHGTLFGFFPVCLSTIQGFSQVDPTLVRLASVLGASRRQQLLRIMIPAALPAVLNGWRLGAMLSLLAIIGGETIASLAGLGHRIVWYAEAMDTARMFAYIVFVIVMVVATNWLLSRLELQREG